MSVYRPAPPVRLPAVGIAALVAVAGAAFAGVPPSLAAAYLRDVPPAQQRKVNAPIVPVAAQIAAPATLGAAYLRETTPVRAWVMPAVLPQISPAFNFYGPVLQPVGAYLRAVASPAPAPVFAAPPVAAAIPYAPLAGLASYLRQYPQQQFLLNPAEWFAPYAPSDPAYAFNGPVLQPAAAYFRPAVAPPVAPTYAAPPIMAAVPYGPPVATAAYLRDSLKASPAPVYLLQPAADAVPPPALAAFAAYLRPANTSQTGSWLVPQAPPAFVFAMSPQAPAASNALPIYLSRTVSIPSSVVVPHIFAGALRPLHASYLREPARAVLPPIYAPIASVGPVYTTAPSGDGFHARPAGGCRTGTSNTTRPGSGESRRG